MEQPLPSVTGYFGKLRPVRGFVGSALPADFVDRWDTWYSRAVSLTPPAPIAHDDPAWRFAAAAGLFGPLASAGVWRHSMDCDGQRYPFVIACLGHALAVDDPWFDAAEELLTAVVEGEILLTDLTQRITWLSDPVPVKPRNAAMLMWRDDWEVHELSFATGREFAAFGLPERV
jgi:type VI secretion system ImpM family protein